MKYDSKYERYASSSSKINAHSPASVGASEGDAVTIMECRPYLKQNRLLLSKGETHESNCGKTNERFATRC